MDVLAFATPEAQISMRSMVIGERGACGSGCCSQDGRVGTRCSIHRPKAQRQIMARLANVCDRKQWIQPAAEYRRRNFAT